MSDRAARKSGQNPPGNVYLLREEMHMLEIFVMAAFVLVLIICVAMDISTVIALLIGYFIFFFYGVKKGYGAKKVFWMSMDGVETVKNIMSTFLLIGMVTALWRASGTIPVIICYASRLIHPSVFLVIAFLLNCLVSVLTGTSFGTSATMGVICMTMGTAMGIDPLYVGGAVLSGVFFGDRCSPVSTSALLVSELTKTDLYENIKGMIKTAMVPTVMTCMIYLVMGVFTGSGGEVMDVESMFAGSFTLHWILVLPALVILVLAAFRVQIKKTLAVSITLAAILGLVIQKIAPLELVKIMLLGYEASDPVLAGMMNGGGVSSMVMTVVIVGLSSSYAGIFEGTGMLSGMKEYMVKLGKKITSFGAMIVASALTSMISCNQTLATILTYQLCHDAEPDEKKMAIALEDTVILMAALVPWSIAGAVPVATIGAPMASLALACYLHLVPAWNLLVHVVKRK